MPKTKMNKYNNEEASVFLKEYSSKVYEFEDNRQQLIFDNTGHVFAAQSFLSAAYFVALSIILDRTVVDEICLLYVSVFVSILLLTGSSLSLSVLFRYKYDTLPFTREIKDYIADKASSSDEFPKSFYTTLMIEKMNEATESLKSINDKRRASLNISIILTFISLMSLVVFIIVALFIYKPC